MNGTHIVARSPLYCIDSTGHNQNMLWENRQQKQKNIFVIISCLLDVVPTPSGNIVWFLSVRQYCLNFVGFSPTFDITHIECEHPFQFFYILFLPAASLRLFYVFLLAVYIVAITVFHINRAIKKKMFEHGFSCEWHDAPFTRCVFMSFQICACHIRIVVPYRNSMNSEQRIVLNIEY